MKLRHVYLKTLSGILDTKPVIFLKVAGFAVGGGHVLHMVCDLTIAADNAIFGQTGPKVIAYLVCNVLLELAAKNNVNSRETLIEIKYYYLVEK